MSAFGMIGALGGLGGGLTEQAGVMLADENRIKANADRRDLETFLAQVRDDYAIKAENRKITNDATVRAQVQNEKVANAPANRQIAVDDETAKKTGELEFETKNLGQLTTNEQAKADAKQSGADKDLKGAQARQARAAADYYDAGHGKEVKLDPADKAELEQIQDEAKALTGKIADAKANGSWATDPKTGVSGTPEQRSLETRLTALGMRQRSILSRYRDATNAATNRDPLNLDKPKPGMVGGTGAPPANSSVSPEATAGQRAILEAELPKAQAQIAAAKTEEERNRAQQDYDSINRELARLGPAGATRKPAQAANPTAPAAAPAATSPVAQQSGPAMDPLAAEMEANAAQSAYTAATLPGKRPGLAATPEARQKYVQMVAELRAKLDAAKARRSQSTDQQGRLQVDLGNIKLGSQQGAGLVFPRP